MQAFGAHPAQRAGECPCTERSAAVEAARIAPSRRRRRLGSGRGLVQQHVATRHGQQRLWVSDDVVGSSSCIGAVNEAERALQSALAS